MELNVKMVPAAPAAAAPAASPLGCIIRVKPTGLTSSGIETGVPKTVVVRSGAGMPAGDAHARHETDRLDRFAVGGERPLSPAPPRCSRTPPGAPGAARCAGRRRPCGCVPPLGPCGSCWTTARALDHGCHSTRNLPVGPGRGLGACRRRPTRRVAVDRATVACVKDPRHALGARSLWEWHLYCCRSSAMPEGHIVMRSGRRLPARIAGRRVPVGAR